MIACATPGMHQKCKLSSPTGDSRCRGGGMTPTVAIVAMNLVAMNLLLAITLLLSALS